MIHSSDWDEWVMHSENEKRSNSRESRTFLQCSSGNVKCIMYVCYT